MPKHADDYWFLMEGLDKWFLKQGLTDANAGGDKIRHSLERDKSDMVLSL
jgi:hypothetical protein